MDEYPDIFKRSIKGAYICVCETWLYTHDDAIDHFKCGEIDGFCVNGLKRNHINPEIYSDQYECICGHKADRYDMLNHHKLYARSCITAYLVKQNSHCDICNVDCKSVINYEIHCRTNKHRLNKEGRTIVSLECSTCKIKCLSQNQMKIHLETKKHQDMVAKGEISEDKISLTCDICKIVCPSQKTIRAHLETKKHQKNLLNNS